MRATTWLDQDTFAEIVAYCVAQPGFNETKYTNAWLTLFGFAPPDISPFDPGSVLVEFEGGVDACADLFYRSLAGDQRRPSVTVCMEMPHEGAEPPSGQSVSMAPDTSKLVGHEVAVHYGHRDHSSIFCGVADIYPDRHRDADANRAEGVLKTFLQAADLEAAMTIRSEMGEARRLRILDESFVEAPVMFPQHTAPDTAYLREIVRSGRYPVTLQQASIKVFGLAPETLPRRTAAFVEALGPHLVTYARADYSLKPEAYSALRRATQDVMGRWRVTISARPVCSVIDLAEWPESLPPDIVELNQEFEASFPVLGQVVVKVEAKHNPGADFQYRLRFYFDYERPSVRREPLADTVEGQALPNYAEMERAVLMEGPGRSDLEAPENLALFALLRHWGNGRDLIDHDYEE